MPELDLSKMLTLLLDPDLSTHEAKSSTTTKAVLRPGRILYLITRSLPLLNTFCGTMQVLIHPQKLNAMKANPVTLREPRAARY